MNYGEKLETVQTTSGGQCKFRDAQIIAERSVMFPIAGKRSNLLGPSAVT